MNRIRIIWKSNNTEKKVGYLRLSERLTEEGRTRVVSLRLPPIHQRHFDVKKQRVKKTHSEYTFYNNKIEETIKKYEKHRKPTFIFDDKKTLRLFVEEKIIPFTKSVGTKQKYLNVLGLLERFNSQKYNRQILLFKDINEDFINQWKVWLRNERGILENSISYKTKTFKSFINKSIKQNYFFYNPNPFNNITNKVIPTNVDYLDESQITSILYGEVYDVIKSGKNKGKKRPENSRYKQELNMNDIRNFFIFQFFSHGLRVSDLMTLRWNNLTINNDEIRLKKVMLKTKYPINTLIYYKPLVILFNYLPEKFIKEEVRETYQILKSFNHKFGSFSFFSERTKTIDIDFVNRNLKIELKNVNQKILKLLVDNEKHQDISSIYISRKGFENQFNKIKRIKQKKIEKYYNSSPYVLKNKKSDIIDKREFIVKKLNQDEELIYLNKLKKILINKSEKKVKQLKSKIEKTYLNLYKEMIEIIKQILTDEDVKYNFIFPLLQDKDFKNIKDERNFLNMSEYQYNKMSGRRSYYNYFLKTMGNQLGIPNLTSHKSRHTFTSLLIQKNPNINLYDLSKSLGHTHIKTTETYIQNFTNIRIDEMGKNFTDSFGGIL